MEELRNQLTKEKIGRELSNEELKPLINRVDVYMRERAMEEEEAIKQVITEATTGLRMAKERKMREYGDPSGAFADSR